MQRITKSTARKMFAAGEVFLICPRKLRPGGPFNSASRIHGKEWQEAGAGWRGPETPAETWVRMYNEWAYYNTSYEVGYYAHYYIEG